MPDEVTVSEGSSTLTAGATDHSTVPVHNISPVITSSILYPLSCPSSSIASLAQPSLQFDSMDDDGNDVCPTTFSPIMCHDDIVSTMHDNVSLYGDTRTPSPISSHTTSPDLSPCIMSSSPTSLSTQPSCSSSCGSSVSIDLSRIDDVGILLRSMPQSAIRNLTPKEKFSLLINHFKPNSNFKFPSRYTDGCNRSCQHNYFTDNTWFVYSKFEDGIFCLPCVLFASKPSDLGQFVSVRFDTWSRKTRKFAEHNMKQYHKLALVRVDALKSSNSKTNYFN